MMRYDEIPAPRRDFDCCILFAGFNVFLKRTNKPRHPLGMARLVLLDIRPDEPFDDLRMNLTVIPVEDVLLR
jgi:hypothetical protein